MSRLDRHIGIVRGKLTLDRFFEALALAGAALAGAVFVAVVIDRLFHLHLPRPGVWLLVGLGGVVIAGLGYALLRRPTAHEAAVAIDERLALKEKFSTALYARGSADPFAQAAVKDAEHTADAVSLSKRFPLTFPRPAYGAMALAVVAFLAFWLMPSFDLFGRQAETKRAAEQQQKREEAERVVKQALVKIEALPKAVADEKEVQAAKRDLEKLLRQPMNDPEKAMRTAASAQQDAGEAMKKEIEKNAKYALAEQASRMLKSAGLPTDAKGPARDAQENMMKGQFAEAAADLKELAEEFSKMEKKAQEDAAKQMAALAKQLEEMAKQMQQNAPQNQTPQQVANQLQKAGLTPQQAQQMAKNLQQAAAGNPQAQQQLQNQLQQAMKQMQQAGNQQGAQQLQQAVQQMQQAGANAGQAQQLAQAAQAMAGAMQQMQQAGNNPQNNAQAQQAMAQAQAQMQAQLQQMGATAADMAAMQAQLQALQQAAQQAAGQCAGNGQDGQQAQAGGQGQWKAGDPKGQGQGNGGPGIGAGPRDKAGFAPYNTKAEKSPVKDNPDGQILAMQLVSAPANKGESKIKVEQMKQTAQQDIVDEVEQDVIPREVQKAVRDYYDPNK